MLMQTVSSRCCLFERKCGENRVQSMKTRLIFQAAIDVFSEYGFAKATMDQIAAKANVAKGTIYYHFKSKEELFVFLVKEGTELLQESVLTHIPETASATAKIQAIIRAQLAFFKEYRDFCIIILREAWGENGRQREFRRMLVHYVHAIQSIVESGVETGELVTPNAEAAAWSLFGAISITALHHLFMDRDCDLDKLAPTLQKMLLEGLSPPPV